MHNQKENLDQVNSVGVQLFWGVFYGILYGKLSKYSLLVAVLPGDLLDPKILIPSEIRFENFRFLVGIPVTGGVAEIFFSMACWSLV